MAVGKTKRKSNSFTVKTHASQRKQFPPFAQGRHNSKKRELLK